MADNTPVFPSISGAQPQKRQRRQDLFQQTATAGLQTYGGQVFFDYGDYRLRGPGQYKIFSEMGDDPAVGALLYLLQNIVRGVSFSVRPHDESPEASQLAEFIESCMYDMDEPWEDFCTKAVVQTAQYGHAPYEQVYKMRSGTQAETAEVAGSKHDDGLIGWNSFQLIGQDSIVQWEFDALNKVTGLWQQAAPTWQRVYISGSRLLNFRNAPYKDGPTGRSMLRRCVTAWVRKKSLEDMEVIGIEKRMIGTAVVKAPPQVLDDSEGNPNAGLRESLKQIARDVRNNEDSGILMPLAYDDAGREMFSLELLQGGDSAGVNIGVVIERLNQEIFRSSLADFLGLGQGSNSGGSYAMATSKTEIFILGIRAYLRVVCDLLNRVAIPRLLSLNGMDLSLAPEIDHSPLEQVDAQSVCASLQSLSAAGFQVVDNDVLTRLFEIMGLPTPKLDEDGMPATPTDAELSPTTPDEMPQGRPVPPAKPPNQDAPTQQQQQQQNTGTA